MGFGDREGHGPDGQAASKPATLDGNPMSSTFTIRSSLSITIFTHISNFIKFLSFETSSSKNLVE